MKKNKKNNKGFSLIEVIVTASIIMALSSVALPQYLKYRTKALRTSASTYMSLMSKAEKLAYTDLGIFTGFTVSGGYHMIHKQRIVPVCPAATKCQNYNLYLCTGGGCTEAVLRTLGSIHANNAAFRPTNYEDFSIHIEGDIDDDTPVFGDILAKYGANATVDLYCDDVNNEIISVPGKTNDQECGN